MTNTQLDTNNFIFNFWPKLIVYFETIFKCSSTKVNFYIKVRVILQTQQMPLVFILTNH